MNRGEVWWCDIAAPDGRRPAVILTRDSAIRFLTAVVVAPITTTIRPSPSFVNLSIEDGLFADCAVNCDRLLTLSKRSLAEYITSLSEARLAEVDAAVRFALDLGGN